MQSLDIVFSNRLSSVMSHFYFNRFINSLEIFFPNLLPYVVSHF